MRRKSTGTRPHLRTDTGITLGLQPAQTSPTCSSASPTGSGSHNPLGKDFKFWSTSFSEEAPGEAEKVNSGVKEQGSGAGEPPIKGKYRLVVMGAARVGKTAIINRFLYDRFTESYMPTVEQLHHGEFNIRGSKLQLDILDTSGSYSFPAMRKLSITTADAFILVYSVNDKASFEEIQEYRHQIVDEKGLGVPIVVVANKIDLSESSREVSSILGEATASIDWGHGYVEASAKGDSGIDSIFSVLLKQAKVALPPSGGQRPSLKQRRVSMTLPAWEKINQERIDMSKHRRVGRKNSCKVS